MASIDITTQSGAVGNGDLQLQNGAPMDATLRFVTDAVNTASPLKLSTSLVQTTSTLKITTNDNPYIDAEDGSGNNRFTVGRAPASQQVNVDFASNPAGSTTAVGAIRTFRDGTNLSEAMTFIEDGSVGIGTTAPVGLLDLYKAAAATRLAIRGDAGQNRLISYRTGALQRFGLYVNNTAESGANAGSDFAIRAYSDAGTLLSTPLFIQRSTGNVMIRTTTSHGTLTIEQPVSEVGLVVNSSTASAPTLYLRDAGGAGYSEILANNKLYINSVNVGIGTATPASKLTVQDGNASLRLSSYSTSARYGFGNPARADDAAYIQYSGVGDFTGDIIFATNTSAGSNVTAQEKMRLSSDNYLRMAASTGGIQFNGDTAAANALDDYEEGTWTMGITFGGGSTGNVYVVNTGTYTKIGRQVTVNGQIGLSTKGSSTGVASLSGLPFTVGNATAPFFASASIWFNNVNFAGQFQSRTEVATTNLQLWQTSILGVISQLNDTNFANNSEIAVSLTYFVV